MKLNERIEEALLTVPELNKNGKVNYEKAAKLITEQGEKVSRVTVGNWIKGITNEVSVLHLCAIQSLTGYSLRWIASEDGLKLLSDIPEITSFSPDSRHNSGVGLVDSAITLMVPVMENSVSMGSGKDQIEDDAVIGSLPISRKWAEKRLSNTSIDSLHFLPAYGDSMSPTFNDGDILLVDASILNVTIDGIYVLWVNDRYYAKRVTMKLNGAFEVSSDNASIKTTDDLDGSKETEIKGRVVWAWNGKKL